MKIITDYYQLKDNIRTEFIKYWYADEEEPDNWLDYLADPNEWYWIGNWNVMGISDAFFNLEDIIYVLEHSVPRDILLDWYWETLEDHTNLPTYLKIRGEWEHEDFLKFQEAQKKKRLDPKEKARVKKELDEIWDKGMKELEKIIKKHD